MTGLHSLMATAEINSVLGLGDYPSCILYHLHHVQILRPPTTCTYIYINIHQVRDNSPFCCQSSSSWDLLILAAQSNCPLLQHCSAAQLLGTCASHDEQLQPTSPPSYIVIPLFHVIQDKVNFIILFAFKTDSFKCLSFFFLSSF